MHNSLVLKDITCGQLGLEPCNPGCGKGGFHCMINFYIDSMKYHPNKKEYILWTVKRKHIYHKHFRIALGTVCPEYVAMYDKYMMLV